MRNITRVAVTAALALTAGCGLPIGGGATEPSAPATAPTTAPTSAPASVPASDGASAPASALPSDPASAPASDPAGPSASAPASGGAPTPADPNQPAAGDQLGQVFATRTASYEGTKLTMNVYPIRRDGGTSHLNLSMESSNRINLGQVLSDGNYQAIDDTGFAADGLQLVDGKNSKVHLVASDGNGQCLCSRNLLQARPSSSNPVLISATFAAPPTDVTTVDVRIPNFGTVSDVPVQ